MSRTVRVFRPRTEREIEARFGIVRPVTDAVRLLRAGQENTPRWLAARSATVGASEISILMMSDHPYHSIFSLWHVKRHGWGQHDQTDAQERGHLLEPGIARRFADAHPELIIAKANGGLWADPANPHLSCTPDYLTINEAGVVTPLELKSDEGGADWGPDDEQVPGQVWWQINQQSGVFAAPHGWVARWNGRGYRDYLIGYDHDRYVKGAAQARQFLDDVASGLEPEPDEHRATGAILREEYPDVLSPLAPVRIPDEWGDERDALKASMSEIKKQVDGIDHRIRALLGSAAVGYDLKGRVYNRTQTPRRGYTVKPTVIDKVTSTAPHNIEETP